ncbi:hypothetical protein G7046_g4508 [Stylonectria norvegica]|nr:hypothetical protein G7046_g4508 [Stylonectria norvegica]
MANTIVVVGAGVSGLTSALLLSKNKANKITVVGKHMPGDYDIEYASPFAGANVVPMATKEKSRWERRSWPELKRLTEEVPEAGLHFQKCFIQRRQKDLDQFDADAHADSAFQPNPWYKDMFPDFREQDPSEVTRGYESGCEYTAVCINTAIYLPWLVGQCLKNGVVFKRAVLTDIREAKHLSHTGSVASIIVNATGLGSYTLGGVKDTTMSPARGQTVLVRNESSPMLITSGSDDGPTEETYLMMRAAGGGTILGGTYDLGNWESQPDPNIAVRIMQRIVEARPEIANGKGVAGLSVIRHAVGLRPYRKDGVRIEEERLDDETWIVHNYGHSDDDIGVVENMHFAGRNRAPQFPSLRIVAAHHHALRSSKLHTLTWSSPSIIAMSQSQPALPARAIGFVSDVANGRHALSKLIPPLLWLADAVLCGLIIWKVPYTEIDWTAYMEQVAQFVSGERDYTKIEGGTGPLVYPAAHVYTYTGLYYLTNEGKNVVLAQQLFAVLYMATLAVVMLCYWKARVPPYIYPLLILSKRLHSVFVLRCFNDCFAVFFLWLAIYCFQRRYWTFGSIAYSWGLGIKMSLLLVLPAVGVILFLGRGFGASLRLAWLMVQVQLAIATPFLAKNPRGYLARAFELSREFKFEWTVNWRMLGEELFLNKSFALLLLAFHATVLFIFVATRWIQPADRPLSSMIPAFLRGRSPFNVLEERRISHHVTPEYVMTTILSANVIGLLFARSLHYQFYAYLAWATPYLLWRATRSPLVVYSLWFAQEWAWNVFPSTDSSSSIVVNVLLITVVLVYLGTDNPAVPREPVEIVEAKEK